MSPLGLFDASNAEKHPSLKTVGSASVLVQGNCQHFAHFGTKANRSMRVAVEYIWAFLKKMADSFYRSKCPYVCTSITLFSHSV